MIFWLSNTTIETLNTYYFLPFDITFLQQINRSKDKIKSVKPPKLQREPRTENESNY